MYHKLTVISVCHIYLPSR